MFCDRNLTRPHVEWLEHRLTPSVNLWEGDMGVPPKDPYAEIRLAETTDRLSVGQEPSLGLGEATHQDIQVFLPRDTGYDLMKEIGDIVFADPEDVTNKAP